MMKLSDNENFLEEMFIEYDHFFSQRLAAIMYVPSQRRRWQ
jgi:hypothetical protein